MRPPGGESLRLRGGELPYPIAHPAAIIPLRGILGRYGVVSALVIGCMAPDIRLLAPDIDRTYSHSLYGVLWLCLPISFAAYLVYHLILKRPLFDLLPHAMAARSGHLLRGPLLPCASWTAVLFSLAVGALTHLGWDAFTHEDGLVVASVPLLRGVLGEIYGYRLSVFQMLQHASTLLGTLFVAWWCANWIRRAPACPVVREGRLSPGNRMLWLMAFVGAALWGALASLLPRIESATSIEALRLLARSAASGGAMAFCAVLLAYAIGWWALRSPAVTR